MCSLYLWLSILSYTVLIEQLRHVLPSGALCHKGATASHLAVAILLFKALYVYVLQVVTIK